MYRGENNGAIVFKLNAAQLSASVPSWRSIWDDLRKYSYAAEIDLPRHCKMAPASVLVHTLGNGDPSNLIRHYFVVNQK